MHTFERLKIIWISIYDAIRIRGLGTAFILIWVALKDEREDKRLGLISDTFLDPKKTEKGPSGKYANYYQPIRSVPFRQLLAELKPDKEQHFVDIGAGAGKGMILAAEYGFRKARGVELVGELCEIAKGNIQRFRTQYPQTEFQLEHGDALEFAFHPNDGFFLMNDPFSEEVFRPFLDRLQNFYASKPITLVYKNNALRQIPSLKKLRARAKFHERDIWGNYFEVYRLN